MLLAYKSIDNIRRTQEEVGLALYSSNFVRAYFQSSK
jgi:hypothetical protein